MVIRRPVERAEHASAVAFDYAWWLTGDREAAAAAVRAALSDPAVQGAEGRARTKRLLSGVRGVVPEPRMFPESELALLHDRHGLSLEDAAALTRMAVVDAPAQLALGRFEALPPDDLPATFAHPERLGGLAVGSHDDVAHARRCGDCGVARALLARGRTAIRRFPQIVASADSPADGPGVADGLELPAGHRPATRAPSARDWVLPAVAIGVTGAAGALAAGYPLLVLAGAAAAALMTGVVLHPPLAAYVLLGVTPLVVGMDRGAVLPLLRPNEALMALVAVGMIVRGGINGTFGRRLASRLTRLDTAMLGLVVTGSVVPVLWLVARGKPLTQDDLLYALTMWKYYGLFLLVRVSVRTQVQVRRCLAVSMAAATVVAVVGILQALQLFNVPELLAAYYAPFQDAAHLQINRATSTIAQEHAVADFLVFNLAIALGWLLRIRTHRVVVVAAAVIFALGGLASGTFSGVLAMVVGVVAVGVVTRRLRWVMAAFLPVGMLGMVLLQPVLQRRLLTVTGAGSMPSSWLGRWENLTEHIWPQLFSGLNLAFGVRPAARVPAPEAWREWIFIESGYTWLLWTGGIPFFVAFLVFLWIAGRTVWRVARTRDDAVGVAAVASFTALCVVGLLMTLDPHFTLRGSADLSFPLLALATVAVGTSRYQPQPRTRAATSSAKSSMR